MKNIVDVLIGIGAIVISFLLCSFLIVLNEYKDEIWDILEFKDEESNERVNK